MTHPTITKAKSLRAKIAKATTRRELVAIKRVVADLHKRAYADWMKTGKRGNVADFTGYTSWMVKRALSRV